MEMKIDGALVRNLRLRKSWSQEMLADEADLNLRTIQRVEAKGIASLHSRRAVAAALSIDPSELEVAGSDQAAVPPAHESRAANQTSGPSIMVGLYACTAALFFGLVIVDQRYAYLIDSRTASAETDFVFSEVADFLLQFGFLTTLIAVGAIVVAWRLRWVRLLLVASVSIGIVAEVLFVPIVNNLFPEVWNAMSENNSGAPLRFSAHALGAALAFWGWIALIRSRAR